MEMRETVFNLFVYIEGDLVRDLGVVSHDVHGSESNKVATLQKHVNIDFTRALRYPVPTDKVRAWLGLDADADVTYDMFSYLSRTGNALRIFEEVLQDVGAPTHPIVCITPIQDGKPRVDTLIHVDPVAAQGAMLTAQFDATVHKRDYLSGYLSADGLSFDDLLGDDFLTAIRVLYERKHYVSAMKLLLSFVDTLAFLEFGDVPGNFKTWMTAYADLAPVGISPSELWEFRNAILHMTNPRSRKVLAGQEPALCFYSDPVNRQIVHDKTVGAKMFSFEALYESIIVAIGRWTATFAENYGKQAEFIGRYDEILSEGRVGRCNRTVELRHSQGDARQSPFPTGNAGE